MAVSIRTAKVSKRWNDEDVVNLLKMKDEGQNDRQSGAPAVENDVEEVNIPGIGKCNRVTYRDAATGEVIGTEYENRLPQSSETDVLGQESHESHPQAFEELDLLPLPPAFGQVFRPRPA